jgi:hypothetical protein
MPKQVLTDSETLLAEYARAVNTMIHASICHDAACEECAHRRERALLARFDGAGEDVSCPDCGAYSPPWNITDEVEEAVL